MYQLAVLILNVLFGYLACSGAATASVLYRRPAPFNAQLALQIQNRMKESNAVIPGGSLFFYMEDLSNHLFTIASIAMSPTPCQMYSGPPLDLRRKLLY